MEDAIKLKPDLNDFIKNSPHCITVIRGFKGTVMFNVYKETWKNEDGEEDSATFLKVEGYGTKNGKRFMFKGIQTSL